MSASELAFVDQVVRGDTHMLPFISIVAISMSGAASAALLLQAAAADPAADPVQRDIANAVVAAAPEPAPEPAVQTKPGKKKTKPEKITDQKHPEFVRCRTEPVLGSRASARRTCMTNREWEVAAREGNRNALEMVNSGRPQQPLP